MEERDLLNRAIAAQINKENDRQCQQLGLLMRKRMVALINMPREEDPLRYLEVTIGKKFKGDLIVGKEVVGFILESDNIDTADASGLSLSIPVLEEKITIDERGMAEIWRQDSPPTVLPERADLHRLMEYYGYLGLIESQFPIPEEPTGPFPLGVIPFVPGEKS